MVLSHVQGICHGYFFIQNKLSGLDGLTLPEML